MEAKMEEVTREEDPEVTFDQALALVEQMTGWIDFSDEKGAPRSPHVVTHLEAVLGSRNLPSLYEYHGSFRDCANKAETARRNPAYRSDAAKRLAESSVPGFISYFKGCVQVLCAKLGIPAEMGTTFPAGEVALEQALAFVEVLIGFRVRDFGNGLRGAEVSPYCMTHLGAVLGEGRVPAFYQMADLIRCSEKRAPLRPADGVAFLTYLARVVRALDDALALPPEEGSKEDAAGE